MENKTLPQDQTLQAIACNHNALLLTGNIFDLQIEADSNSLYYRPIFLAEQLHNQDYIVLRYSRSEGFSVHRANEIKTKNKVLQDALRRTGLNSFLGKNEISPTEVIEIFRGIKQIMTNKFDFSFAVIIDYLPHLSACQSPSIEERIVSETLNECANLPAVKKHGNVIVAFSHEEGNLSPLLNSFHRVNYSYPDLESYKSFFKILTSREEEFAQTSISTDECAKLARGLRLSDLAGLFKEFKVKNKTIDRQILLQKKEELIDQISDRTLKVMSTNLTFDDLAGLEVPKAILGDFAEKMARQDITSPRAILLAGPPGTGKTTIVETFANACGFNLVSFAETKSKWVGESESRLALALELIEALSPAILFIDEIDQQFKNRSESSLDGGVSQHYLSELFKFAAREDLRGKVCIVGCSNTPQLLDPAMINRFITLPVLESTPVELAHIFPKIEKRLGIEYKIDPQEPALMEACEILYEKGASPRQLFEIINAARSRYGAKYTGQNILDICRSFRSSTNPSDNAYSSLASISLAAFDFYLPWFNDPANYPYAWYLEKVVSRENGLVNEQELRKQMAFFKSQSNF